MKFTIGLTFKDFSIFFKEKNTGLSSKDLIELIENKFDLKFKEDFKFFGQCSQNYSLSFNDEKVFNEVITTLQELTDVYVDANV
jgi:hypothetical protein